MPHRPLPRPARRAGLCLLALCLLLSLPVGCGRETADVEDILAAMCDSQPPLPAGQVYVHTAVLGDEGYADDELIAALFGDGAKPREWEAVNAFAFRLSTVAAPHELAVLQCVCAQDAYEVARMCLRRADAVRRLWRNGAYAAQADAACVSVCGRYVLFGIAEDAPAAIAAGRRAIRGR